MGDLTRKDPGPAGLGVLEDLQYVNRIIVINCDLP
jgi:hypothetical protein